MSDRSQREPITVKLQFVQTKLKSDQNGIIPQESEKKQERGHDRVVTSI
jgi:hypothetical protein